LLDLFSIFIFASDFRHAEISGEVKVTVDVKGELSEEEREAIKEVEKQKLKMQEKSKILDSLEIIAPGVNRGTKEEVKDNEEDLRKRSNSLYRNSLLMRKCEDFLI